MKLVSKIKTLLVFLFLVNCILSFKIKHGRIYDDQNKEIYFHGTNVVVQVPPYLPKTDAYDQHMSFSQEDVDKLKQNGFNAIRLGIMWPGVQPQKGKYNETYLQQMKKIIKMAGDSGIYTLIQFHQHVLSQSFCGVGVPVWLIQEMDRYRTFPFPIQRHKYPLNNDTKVPDKIYCNKHKTCDYYFSYDVAQGFQELYKDNSYLNQRFHALWQKIASTFNGNKNVIAYELINSPWVGNQFRNPFLILPRIAQKLRLQNFYDRLSETIRLVDQKTLISFEIIKEDGMWPTGLYHAPGGKYYHNQSILTYHYGQSNLKTISTRVKDAKKLGVASVISKLHINRKALQKADQYYQSWFYWGYKDFGKNKTNDQTPQKNYKNVEKIQEQQSLPHEEQQVQIVNSHVQMTGQAKNIPEQTIQSSQNDQSIKKTDTLKSQQSLVQSKDSDSDSQFQSADQSEKKVSYILKDEQEIKNQEKPQQKQEKIQQHKLMMPLNLALEDDTICPLVVRTYLQRVAGCLEYTQFCDKTGRFIAAYSAWPDGQTLLYMNKDKTYGNKYSIEVSPKDQVQVMQNTDGKLKNYVVIKFKGKERTQVIINVIKKSQ